MARSPFVRRARRRVRMLAEAGGARTVRHLLWRLVRRPAPPFPPTVPSGRCCLVYRSRNSDRVAALVSPLRRRGWDVRLWALDDVASALRDITVGHGPGGRTELLNRLAAGADGPVVILDDDVEFDRGGDLAHFVDAASLLDLDVAQPAHTWDSVFSHPLTLSRPWLAGRVTTFVEVGPVVFLSADAQRRLLPMEEESVMGWGLDVRWSDLLGEGDLRGGIVDRVAVRHLGAVGAAYEREHEEDLLAGLLRERGVDHVSSLQHTRERIPSVELVRRSVGTGTPPGHVAVGPIPVVDRRCDEVVEDLVAPPRLPYVAFAVHVGALGLQEDLHYLAALRVADVTYADGHAIVHLAQLAGARRIERTPTTDIGYELLRRLAARQGHVDVALVGGTPGLAERAATALERICAGTRVVFTRDGYRPFRSEDFTRLRELDPDVVFVGMGMPTEAVWVRRNLDALPHSRIVTCGGWFGFVAGDEKRAPRFLQGLRLEWFFRMLQAPRRLAGRYAMGLVRTLAMDLRLRRARGDGA